MTQIELTRDTRLKDLGGLLVETTSFQEASRTIRRTYDGWRTHAEGTCSFIVGMSGAGKTTVADDFLEALSQDLDAEFVSGSEMGNAGTWGLVKSTETGLVRPVIKVFIGPRIRLRGLLFDLLLALGVRANRVSNFGELMSLAIHHLTLQKVKLVIFDETHHIVEGHGPSTAYEAADLLKMLLIQSRVQIVCLGLPHTLEILNANPQLARRCRSRYEIKPFRCNVDEAEGDFMQFCAALEANLPFDAPSGLDKPDTAMRLHIAGEGYIGRITNIVQAACEIAIDDRLSRLSFHVLGEAYRNVEGVDDDENPFLSDDPRPEAFVALRVRRRAEWLVDAKPKNGRRKKAPDFTI